MRNIIKVNNIQDAKDNPIRPLLAMDSNGDLFIEGQSAIPAGFVDLGLPSRTLWAVNNIGAEPDSTKESYYGDYYAWGETETKTEYAWYNYEYCYSYDPDEDLEFTKYTGSDGKTILEASDDVVTATYGSNYCMPTATEIQELISGTNNEWVTNYNGITGLNGRKFTNKTDSSKFIFIPAAGYLNFSTLNREGDTGYVWSSSLHMQVVDSAQILDFGSSGVYAEASGRCYGYSVRAIKRV